MTDEQLLAEIEDIIRCVPSADVGFGSTIYVPWWGRASAAIERWNMAKGLSSRLR
jgi:hypothetical protein